MRRDLRSRDEVHAGKPGDENAAAVKSGRVAARQRPPSEIVTRELASAPTVLQTDRESGLRKRSRETRSRNRLRRVRLSAYTSTASAATPPSSSAPSPPLSLPPVQRWRAPFSVSRCVQYPLAVSKEVSYFALPHALPYQHLSPVLGLHLVVLVVTVSLSTSPMSRPGVLVLRLFPA